MSVGLLLPSKEINGHQLTKLKAPASAFAPVKMCRSKSEGEKCKGLEKLIYVHLMFIVIAVACWEIILQNIYIILKLVISSVTAMCELSDSLHLHLTLWNAFSYSSRKHFISSVVVDLKCWESTVQLVFFRTRQNQTNDIQSTKWFILRAVDTVNTTTVWLESKTDNKLREKQEGIWGAVIKFSQNVHDWAAQHWRQPYSSISITFRKHFALCIDTL